MQVYLVHFDYSIYLDFLVEETTETYWQTCSVSLRKYFEVRLVSSGGQVNKEHKYIGGWAA